MIGVDWFIASFALTAAIGSSHKKKQQILVTVNIATLTAVTLSLVTLNLVTLNLVRVNIVTMQIVRIKIARVQIAAASIAPILLLLTFNQTTRRKYFFGYRTLRETLGETV